MKRFAPSYDWDGPESIRCSYRQRKLVKRCWLNCSDIECARFKGRRDCRRRPWVQWQSSNSHLVNISAPWSDWISKQNWTQRQKLTTLENGLRLCRWSLRLQNCGWQVWLEVCRKQLDAKINKLRARCSLIRPFPFEFCLQKREQWDYVNHGSWYRYPSAK